MLAHATKILQEVEAYYNHALTMSLIVVSLTLVLVGAVVGVIVPLILQRWQRRSFEKRLASALETAKTETDKQADVTKEMHEKNLKDILQKTRRDNHHHSAIHWLLLAEAIINTQGHAWPFAITHWCYAIDSALEAGWTPDNPWWDRMKKCGEPYVSGQAFKTMTKDQTILDAIAGTLERLSQCRQIEPYMTLREKLERLVE